MYTEDSRRKVGYKYGSCEQYTVGPKALISQRKPVGINSHR